MTPTDDFTAFAHAGRIYLGRNGRIVAEGLSPEQAREAVRIINIAILIAEQEIAAKESRA